MRRLGWSWGEGDNVMRNVLLSTAASLSLQSCGSAAGNSDPIFKVENFEYDRISDENFVPKAGYVNKPEVAAGIAEAVAIGFYGRSEIEKQRPYLVKRLSDRWVIQGSWRYGSKVKGGVFEIEVASLDGKILRMMHGE
jgi:NTF2 fold immunity protein